MEDDCFQRRRAEGVIKMTNTVPDNEQHRLNLISEHSASVSKFTYFLMSASGAGLGFAITQVNSSEASWAMSMLFLAMMFWCVSFFAGIRNRLLSHGIVEKAVEAEEAKLSNNPNASSLCQSLKAQANLLGDKTLIWSMCQVIAFLFGAISLALWRLWEVLDEFSK